LAQNLLALSSAEVGDASFEQVDLERIAADAYDRYLPLALEKGLTLELDGPRRSSRRRALDRSGAQEPHVQRAAGHQQAAAS
jgi:signal transduction histidine kinase